MLITKDGTVKEVTKGAFKSLFRDSGWRELAEGETPQSVAYKAPVKHQPAVIDKEEPASTPANDIPFAGMMQEEQPQEEVNHESNFMRMLKGMKGKELADFAIQNGVDITGLTKKSQLIEAISEALGD